MFCGIAPSQILHIIIHKSMLYELLSNLIGWFTLTILWLHITLIYLLWRVQVAHIAWIYLLWWIRLSGRCSSAHFTSSDAAYGFIKLQFEKFTQTVAETMLKFYYCLIWARLFPSSSFIDFGRISKKCISWRMLTKFQQSRQTRSRVGQSFAVE